MPDKIEITVMPAKLALVAGDTAEVIATVRNLGQTVDQLTVSLEGIDPTWYTLPVSSVALFPNDHDDLKITLHPPRSAATRAGSYQCRINAVSQENAGEPAVAELTLEVKEMLEVGLEISPSQVMGRNGTYQIVVTNPGSADAAVILKASDAKHRLRYHFNIDRLNVVAGGRAGATLQVSLGWMVFLGGEKAFDFLLAAVSSEDQPVMDQCSSCGKPLKPPVPGELRVFCPHCHFKLRDDAKIVSAEFIRTPLIKGMPHINIPWLSRPPVIDVFEVSTDNRQDFNLAWTVRRGDEILLNGEPVGVSGQKTLRPSQTTTYTITVSNKRKTLSQTIEVQPLALPESKTSERIRVSLSSPELEAYAGTIPANAVLEIQNLGDIVDKFTVDIHGIDESWCSRSASSLALMPGKMDTVQLKVQPPKRHGVKSGEYPFAVSVTSESAPQEVTTVQGRLRIAPAPEFKMEVRPFRVNCRKNGRFRVNLTNTSVTDIEFKLDATDMEEGCKFQFEDHDARLPAWSSYEIPVIVRPKRGSTIGEPKPYDITVTATEGEGMVQQAACQLNHKPLLKSWKTVFKIAKIVVNIILLIVIAYLAIHWGGGWDALTDDPGQWAQDLVDGTFSPYW